MEETKALHRLQEAADLVGMIEDLLNPNMSERMSPSAWSGVRITLRNVKDMISSSHNALATDLINRSKAAAAQNGSVIQSPELQPSGETIGMKPEPRAQGTNGHNPIATRRDLKASLERFIER